MGGSDGRPDGTSVGVKVATTVGNNVGRARSREQDSIKLDGANSGSPGSAHAAGIAKRKSPKLGDSPEKPESVPGPCSPHVHAAIPDCALG